LLVLDADEGTTIEYKFLDLPIMSLRVLKSELSGVRGESLWVLYEGGIVVVISLAEVITIRLLEERYL
jgi:hypothetical protein